MEHNTKAKTIDFTRGAEKGSFGYDKFIFELNMSGNGYIVRENGAHVGQVTLRNCSPEKAVEQWEEYQSF